MAFLNVHLTHSYRTDSQLATKVDNELGGYLTAPQQNMIHQSLKATATGQSLDLSPALEYTTAKTVLNNKNSMTGLTEYSRQVAQNSTFTENPSEHITQYTAGLLEQTGRNWEIAFTDDKAPAYMKQNAAEGVALDIIAVVPLVKALWFGNKANGIAKLKEKIARRTANRTDWNRYSSVVRKSGGSFDDVLRTENSFSQSKVAVIERKQASELKESVFTMRGRGGLPDSAASAIHPGRLAAESDDVSQESIMRALRQSGSVEGAATAKLVKRGNVKINLVPTDPWKGEAAGRAPFGSDTVFLSLDKLPTATSAAGVAAHETRHVLQKLTPPSYRRTHELEAYQWQRAVDPAFNLSDDAITRFIQTHPLYKNVPPSFTGGQ